MAGRLEGEAYSPREMWGSQIHGISVLDLSMNPLRRRESLI
jgi:hypothetical protein